MSEPLLHSINDIVSEAHRLALDVESAFGSLNQEQLNWKPNAQSWSIGQCIDHLITTNTKFYPQIDELVAGGRRHSLWQSFPIIPGLFGKLMINMIKPDSTRKIKVPPGFEPTSSRLEVDIISRFISHQAEFIGRIESTSDLNPENTIIYSPISRLITYSLLDAYRIAVLHERRHFIQAQRVRGLPGFPG